jgi:hypothetical protein
LIGSHGVARRGQRRFCLGELRVNQQRIQLGHHLAVRACLKKIIETRCGRFGVPPLGGFRAVPPKSGTPNRVFKQALSDMAADLDVDFFDSRHLKWRYVMVNGLRGPSDDAVLAASNVENYAEGREGEP